MSNAPTLAERLEQADNSAAQSWVITELLLNAYPATIRQSVIAAAVPHWFTAEILATLLDLSMEEANERYVALQQLSIVQPFGDLGYTLHDLTRSGILVYLAGNALDELRKYSQRVYAYLSNQNSAQDSQTEVESIYHQLIFTIDEGRSTLKTCARDYRSRGNFAAIENLLRNYRELIMLGLLELADQVQLERQEYRVARALADRGKKEASEQGAHYLRKALEQFAPPEQLPELLVNEPEMWREQIDIYKRDFVLNQLETARQASDLTRQPLWLSELSSIYRDQGDLEASLQQLDQALALAPRYGRAWAYRGETKRLMARYEEALADFNHAIKLDGKDAWAISHRGETYRLMKRYEESLVDFDRAIELDTKSAWTINRRGDAYRQMERYGEALENYAQTITLDKKNIWAYAFRGETYRLMQRFDEALTDFNRAIELDEKDVWSIGRRGQVYQALRRYDEAMADFDRAIQLNEKDVWTINRRGDAYRQMKRYNEALENYSQTIAFDEKNTWAFAFRGETYRLLTRYEEALADFDRAIQLNEKDAWAIAARGETYRLMERYEEALADFDHAIQLDNKYAWAIARRGETYRIMKRYEEALADFDRTIQFDGMSAWAIGGRGQVYQALRRYAEALIDFDRAIILNDKSAWTIGNRGYIYLLLNRVSEAHADLSNALSIEESNWRFYCRGLSYLVQSQLPEAQSDLTRAIELANLDYIQDPYNWRNTLNLMLYHLVADNNSMAERFLQEAIDGNAPIPRLKAAIQDLEELLMVLPDHSQARIFLQRIEAHVADLG